MLRILALIVIGLSASAMSAVPSGSIDQFIDRELPRSGAPGLAYAIVDNGKIDAHARGEVLQGSGREVTVDTPFILGSISKSFTALAVVQLVESGQVDLDAPISGYLPEFTDGPGRAITVRQLLSHTSGYSTLQGNQGPADEADGPNALQNHVRKVAQWTPAYAPDARWEYSNANYQILGALVETVSGRDYAKYIEDRILRPIGMDHSFVADGRVHDVIARGHRPWFGSKRALPNSRTDVVTAPQGGIVASVSDLALYLLVMMNGESDVVSAEAKAMMIRPASAASPFYGLGWYIDNSNGTISHTGSTPGVETLAIMDPKTRKGAVILVNAGSGIGFGETAALRNGIAARALGLDYDGEGSRWQQKAVFLSFAIAPIAFMFSAGWAWRHRASLRAKSGAFGQFSLWFPMIMMLALTAVIFLVIPQLFGLSNATMRLFQPDLALAMTATAATGLVWAALRIFLAFGGRRSTAI